MWNLLVHLRLQFQAMLAGIFVWGFALGGGHLDARAGLAFLALHLGLYGGVTAYNSYFDRDVGPITGLRRPPPAGAACRWGGLAFIGAGALAAAWISFTFAAIYAAIAALGIAYSHPRVRFKRHPIASLAVVACGQGALGYWAGAAAAVPVGLPSWTVARVAGMIAVVCLVTGLYPLTQVFQIDEDRARGDRTFAVRYGVAAVFRTTLFGFALGTLFMIPAARSFLHPLEVALLVAALAALAWLIRRWSRRFDAAAAIANHDRVFALGIATSTCFTFLVLRHLLERGP
jgi:1,4-dihydroxy-2-naphthoate octaprenyltransferase